MMRTLLIALAFAAAPSLASATEPCYHFEKVTCYKTITDYVTKEVAYTKQVTAYDHCGKPYTKTVICYREVQVPVQRTVAYEKWVKVYDY
jgi:hypothetical protein